MKGIKHFAKSEFDCKETGENNMDIEFLTKVDHLREICGFPFRITSGFRSKDHSVEIRKPKGGTHTQGIACDIMCDSGSKRYTLVKHALALGFTGIGIADSFIHVDTRTTHPVIWSY